MTKVGKQDVKIVDTDRISPENAEVFIFSLPKFIFEWLFGARI